MRRFAAYLALISTLFLAGRGVAQELPGSIKPDIGKAYYCEGAKPLKGLDGKEFIPIFYVHRLSEVSTVIQVGEKISYPFKDLHEYWIHVPNPIVMSVDDDDKFGNSRGDSLYQAGKEDAGWDVKGNKSSIAARETGFFNSSTSALQGCKRQEASSQ